MDLINLNPIFLSISWRPVEKQQLNIQWEWVAVAALCMLSIYLVLRSANFVLSRLYWTSWKPATAMMALLVTAYACKKAVDMPPALTHQDVYATESGLLPTDGEASGQVHRIATMASTVVQD